MIDDGGHLNPQLQIREDRYYAAHLFGDLKDVRAVPILVPLLRDEEVKGVVPWSLGQIGCTYFPSAVTSFSLATELSWLQRRSAMPNGGGGCMLSV
jgi:hypothetical protein